MLELARWSVAFHLNVITLARVRFMSQGLRVCLASYPLPPHPHPNLFEEGASHFSFRRGPHRIPMVLSSHIVKQRVMFALPGFRSTRSVFLSLAEAFLLPMPGPRSPSPHPIP